MLILPNSKANHSITRKLHSLFAHPTKEKLLQLRKKAGEPWCNNQKLMQEINNVSNNCITCKHFKKIAPRPIVYLPLATEF